MSPPETPYYLLLDTNSWVAERMLQSAVGSAALYALAADGSSIVLPEVVEMEVGLVLGRQAEKAAEDIRKSADFLRQISGHSKNLHQVPTKKAIEDGIEKRWHGLQGTIVRAPFHMEQAKSALQRVLEHSPPSGENNEQFRDCCIWEAAMEFAKTRVVHLVTRDSAFYQKNGKDDIADILRLNLQEGGLDIRLHKSLDRFLEKVSKGTIQELEQNLISDAIIKAVTPRAHEIAAERAHADDSRGFKLGVGEHLKIKGYATPEPSMVAVSYELSFDFLIYDHRGLEESQNQTILTLDGSCSYNPQTHQTSDVTVQSWHHSVKGSSYAMSYVPIGESLAERIRYV